MFPRAEYQCTGKKRQSFISDYPVQAARNQKFSQGADRILEQIFRMQLGKPISSVLLIGLLYLNDVQSAPYIAPLEATGIASFHFAQGSIEDTSATGWEIYGPPPNLRFYEENLVPETRAPIRRQSVNSIVRSYDTDQGGNFPAQESVRRALDEVHSLVNEHGPFDGVVGFSEGGSLAATLLAEDQENARKGLPNRSLKCGIFFSAYPPFTTDGKKLMLSDEFGEHIKVPTLHIMSASDIFYTASIALSKLCVEEQASIYEHSQGHMVPWQPKVSRPLAALIRSFLERLGGKVQDNTTQKRLLSDPAGRVAVC